MTSSTAQRATVMLQPSTSSASPRRARNSDAGVVHLADYLAEHGVTHRRGSVGLAVAGVDCAEAGSLLGVGDKSPNFGCSCRHAERHDVVDDRDRDPWLTRDVGADPVGVEGVEIHLVDRRVRRGVGVAAHRNGDRRRARPDAELGEVDEPPRASLPSGLASSEARSVAVSARKSSHSVPVGDLDPAATNDQRVIVRRR